MEDSTLKKLKALSLVVLVVQNSSLTILLHYSRTAVSPDKLYSASSAVLLNELLKGIISLSIAFSNAVKKESGSTRGQSLETYKKAGTIMRGEVFSSDCWKLGIPAVLYVIQNNLQFVAASNLDVPTFQVSYNLKILTTALFSVLLLKRKLTAIKWIALACLALGVATVQLQSTTAAKESNGHEMNQVKGLLAVASACMTSGLAGVYFEMVLKGSRTDLWIRNCQLSIFSMLPALLPVLRDSASGSSSGVFANFGIWAWAVVLTQVLGGLVTALVIKYSDNIIKGFATSLAIILSFLAGVILFDFSVTLSFVMGTSMVVGATWLYNQPDTIQTSFFPPKPSQLNGSSHTAQQQQKQHHIGLPMRNESSESPFLSIRRMGSHEGSPHSPGVEYDFEVKVDEKLV